jgi:hypothetical protein
MALKIRTGVEDMPGGLKNGAHTKWKEPIKEFA